MAFTIEDVGEAMADVVSAPYIIALVVPIAFYLVGAFSKKIIRDGKDCKTFFALSDWYLAPDALLVSIGSMLAELVTLMANFNATSHFGRTRGVVVLVGFSVCAYVVVLALHRHYESRELHSPAVRCWWLVVVSNIFALAVMMMWLVAVKGVDHA